MSSSDFFDLKSCKSHAWTGHSYEILKRRCSCTARSAVLVERVVNIWNSLRYDAVDFSNLPAFKRTTEVTVFPSSCVFRSLLNYM